MKVVVTGAEGMLGSAVCPALRRQGHEVIPTDLKPLGEDTLALDICDRPAVTQLITTRRPAAVFHLAAETDVDRCEQDPAHAYRVNAVGTEHLVEAAGSVGARFLYMSTAAVFDGSKPAPYVETDLPSPVNTYGRSKLAGEVAVRRLRGAFQIVRAGWMVGGLGRDKKFVGKILRLLEERRELEVVTDKIGSLTFATDLARVLTALLETDHAGIFHAANQGVCSRYEVARKVVDYLGRQGEVTIRPVTSEAFPLPAPRSASEAMTNTRLRALGMDTMPSWEQALHQYVGEYLGATKPCASSS